MLYKIAKNVFCSEFTGSFKGKESKNNTQEFTLQAPVYKVIRHLNLGH
jgi:hypothetical protein